MNYSGQHLSTKSDVMKNLFLGVLVAGSLIACDEPANRDNSIGSESKEPAHENNVTVAYVPEDGDVIYKDGKLMVRKDGEWKLRDEKVTLDNGAVVYTDGLVRKDDKEIKLQEGEIISEEGDVFDKAGQKIESAWKDAKEGVKDAGKEIEKGANKAGDKIEDAVDDDKK
jgi:hypothetical protein